MKLPTLLLLTALPMLVGCHDAKLEQRVANLERRMTETHAAVSNMVDLMGRQSKLNELAMAQVMIMESKLIGLQLADMQLTNHVVGVINSMTDSIKLGTLRIPPAASATTAGVPPLEAMRIKAAAEKKWPGDYRMQQHEIETQTEAYLKVNRR